MTIPAHAELIHAFADGKMLQYKYSPLGVFQDYTGSSCPDFINGGSEWRIKPTPKVTRYLAYQHSDGEVRMALEGGSYADALDGQCKRIPALDKEVTEES